MTTRRIAGGALIAVALLVLIAVPNLARSVGPVLPGPVNSVGSLQVLALVFIAGALAVTLDLMFGYTGLLSMGHALYFGIGCYSVVMYTNNEALGFGLAIPLSIVTTIVCAVVGNAAALKLEGFGFAMATLAFAQLMSIFVERGFLGSGGEFGLTYESDALPDSFVGLANLKYAYWLSLVLLVVVFLVCWFMVRTGIGHVWQAIRENPLRVQVLGYDVYRYQLAAGVIASTLAGVCGIVYSIVMSGANPSIVSLEYSVGLIVMVVLGGRGVLWGAMLGGIIYQLLQLRLAGLATNQSVQDMPDVIRVPLSQPNFIFGVVFVLAILFLPGGLASLVRKRRDTSRPGRSPVEHSSGEDAEAPVAAR